MPPVNVSALKGAEESSVKTSVAVVKVSKILLHIFALGMLVLGAGAFLSGERHLFRKVLYHLFLCQHERADKYKLLFGKEGNRGEASHSSLEKQIEHKGLNGIVVVMTESDLVASVFLRGVVENTAAHS